MLEKFLAVLERIATALEGGAATSPDVVAPARGRGRPPKGEATPPTTAQVQTAVAASTAQPATTATAVGEDKPVETVPTLQKVADAIIEIANNPAYGREAAVAILTAHGVKKVPELKPQQFNSVLAAVEKVKSAPAGGASGLT